MPQENLAGPAGQACGDGVAAAGPGDGAGADVGGAPGGLAAGADSRLHPASAAPAAAAAARRGTALIAERSATAGSIRNAGRPAAPVWLGAVRGFDVDADHRREPVQALLEPGHLGVA